MAFRDYKFKLGQKKKKKKKDDAVATFNMSLYDDAVAAL